MALDYPILVQGTAPRSQLLKQFRETPHAVLFATSSFWQGVDVVGEALSCVIIDKLPFASPGDPITAARIEADPRARRRPVRRVSGAAGHPGAAAGAGPPDPPPAAIAACWPCSTRGCGRRATAGGSSRRCRRRRSCTISTGSTSFFCVEAVRFAAGGVYYLDHVQDGSCRASRRRDRRGRRGRRPAAGVAPVRLGRAGAQPSRRSFRA